MIRKKGGRFAHRFLLFFRGMTHHPNVKGDHHERNGRPQNHKH